MNSAKPQNKIEAVRLLHSLEKQGIKIKAPEQWRTLSYDDLLKLAQRYWKEVVDK